jgi:hypothetical protein
MAPIVEQLSQLFCTPNQQRQTIEDNCSTLKHPLGAGLPAYIVLTTFFFALFAPWRESIFSTIKKQTIPSAQQTAQNAPTHHQQQHPPDATTPDKRTQHSPPQQF